MLWCALCILSTMFCHRRFRFFGFVCNKTLASKHLYLPRYDLQGCLSVTTRSPIYTPSHLKPSTPYCLPPTPPPQHPHYGNEAGWGGEGRRRELREMLCWLFCCCFLKGRGSLMESCCSPWRLNCWISASALSVHVWYHQIISMYGTLYSEVYTLSLSLSLACVPLLTIFIMCWKGPVATWGFQTTSESVKMKQVNGECF